MTPTRQSLDLPRRIRCADPDRGSLECGHQLWHLKAARSWAAHGARTTPACAHPLLVSLPELHANALKHSASGLPGGRVRIEIERRRRLFLLRVTDGGPRPGTPVTVPEARPVLGECGAEGLLVEGGYGLALVDAMALYWDFTREPDGGLTLRAAFDRSGPLSTDPGEPGWPPENPRPVCGRQGLKHLAHPSEHRPPLAGMAFPAGDPGPWALCGMDGKRSPGKRVASGPQTPAHAE